MQMQTVAIAGLGRVGSVFLEKLLAQSAKGISIVAVAEKGETAGVALAKANGINNVSLDQLIEMGGNIDILFDLTGIPAVRQELRDKLLAAGNRHTVIATESIAMFIWVLISEGDGLPNVHLKTGY
ncbi:MAG: hypothetical protein WC742_08460 [Gallionellaceae bacterium]|jgi:predicted dinucleotide-utilizing enzyme